MTSALLNPQVLDPASADQMASIDTLHALHGQRIFRFLLASLRDRDAAETLLQETFLRAWTARDQFRGDCSAVTWLTRIALNLVRDHTRTNRFRFWRNVSRTAIHADDLAAHLPDRASSTEASLIAHQQLALVWDTVATLSERQRTIFLLRFVEELELTDIAQITGLPLSTVKTHLYRALATIRERHQPHRKDSK
jgi:RNA polymerase sigma-70 factor (ECF subfamily)